MDSAMSSLTKDEASDNNNDDSSDILASNELFYRRAIDAGVCRKSL